MDLSYSMKDDKQKLSELGDLLGVSDLYRGSLFVFEIQRHLSVHVKKKLKAKQVKSGHPLQILNY